MIQRSLRGLWQRLAAPRRARQFRTVRLTPALELLEDRTLLSTATWSGAKDSTWSNPNNWQEGFVPGPNDTAVFDDTATNFHATVDSFYAGQVGGLVITWHDPNAVIELDSPLTAGTLQMDRGTVTGPADLTVGGGSWNGGVWSPSRVTILSGGQFTLGGSDLKLIQCNVDNFGTTVWAGDGDIASSSSSPIAFDTKPGAAFQITNDAHWYVTGTAAFVNEGMLSKTDSPGTSTFDLSFNNLKTSTTDLVTGTVSMTGGGKTVSPVTVEAGAVLQDTANYTLDGAIITGAGTFQQTGDGLISIIKTVHVDNFELDSGQLGYLGNLEISQSFTWTGGTVIGEIDIDADAVMNITGDATKAVKLNALVSNAGTVIWTGAGAIDLDGVFTNQVGATFDAESDAEIYSLGNGTFNNLGAFSKSAGDGVTVVQLNFANTGMVEGLAGDITLYRATSSPGDDPNGNVLMIDDGAFVDLFDCTLDGTTISGGGVLREVEGGQTNIAGEVTADNVELNDGVIATDAGDLTINDTFLWTKGYIIGSGGYQVTIAPTATLAIVGPSARILSGNLTNEGTAYWLSSGNVSLTPGSVLTNAPGALFLAQTNADLDSQGTVQNQGTFQIVGTASTNTLIDITFVNTGELDVLGGMLSLGKPFVNNGTVFIGAGATLAAGATYTQAAGVTDLEGGTLSAMPTVTVQANGLLTGWGTIDATLVNNGQLSIGEDDLTGTLTVTGDYTQTATGVLNMKIGGTADGDSDQFVVQGTATLDDTGATLNVSLTNGFNPEVGESFAVMTYGALVGQFATINLPTFDGGQFQAVYLANSLTLVTVPNS